LAKHFDFPDETASQEEVEAAVRADPVVNSHRVRYDAVRTREQVRETRERARQARAYARALLDEGRLRRFLKRR
jgi:hypothetical protein